MKKLFFLICLAAIFFYPPKVRAVSFPVLDAMITPLPVTDIVTTPILGGMVAQQIIAALVAVLDYGNRQSLQQTMSKDGPVLTKRAIEVTNPPVIKPIKSAKDTGISVLENKNTKKENNTTQSNQNKKDDTSSDQNKTDSNTSQSDETNKTSNSDLSIGKSVDVTNPKEVAEAVEKEIMQTTETSSVGLQKEQEKRNLFAQENAISAMANALYFDYLLEDLQKTVDELSVSSAQEDKYGAVNANYRYMSTWYKLLTLLEQIKAERLQLKGALGVLEANPVRGLIVGES